MDNVTPKKSTRQHKPSVGSEGKETLLLVAFQLFLQKGYEGTSLSELLSVSGMAKGSLYYHFASKDVLYQAVLERFFLQAFDSVEQSPPDIVSVFPYPTFENVTSSQRTFLEFSAGYLVLLNEVKSITPDLVLYYRFLMEAASKRPDLKPVVAGHWNQAINQLSQVLIKDLHVTEADAYQRARELTGLIEGLGLIFCVTHKPEQTISDSPGTESNCLAHQLFEVAMKSPLLQP